jgi:phosphate transport system substrate-binding protein
MMDMKLIGVLLRSSLLAAVLACGLAGAAELDVFKGKQGKIDIAGGTAHIPVMKEAAKRIMQANREIRISVGAGGSGVGVQKVGEGLVDIGNTGRALSDAEVAKYGLKSFAFALDGVAVVVNPKNPVTDLKAAQIQDIFAGRITNWKAVGGRDAAIHLYTRDEASGTREVFSDVLLKKGAIAETANVASSNGAMKSAVAGDDDAIGYDSIGFIDQSVKAPTLDGVSATQDNARSGRYPIVRKLYMNTKGTPQGLTADFITYVLSAEGAQITAAAGYFPLK